MDASCHYSSDKVSEFAIDTYDQAAKCMKTCQVVSRTRLSHLRVKDAIPELSEAQAKNIFESVVYVVMHKNSHVELHGLDFPRYEMRPKHLGSNETELVRLEGMNISRWKQKVLQHECVAIDIVAQQYFHIKKISRVKQFETLCYDLRAWARQLPGKDVDLL